MVSGRRGRQCWGEVGPAVSPPCWEICWETLSPHPRGEPRLIGVGVRQDHKAVMFHHVENSSETTLTQVCV